MSRQTQRQVRTQQVRQQADRLWIGLTQAWRQAVVLSRPVTQDILTDVKKGILWSDHKMNDWLKGRTTRSNRNLIKTSIRVGIAIVALLLIQVTVLVLLALTIGLGIKSVVRLNQLPTVNDERYDDYQDP
ncbi:MAG: hypothetical protein HC924_04690 [Synechococcaceae cyanobacterium SM2_3_2]|nr:hypothetical protein [Synechococcaceae cyanobacterium SM2_3_2]